MKVITSRLDWIGDALRQSSEERAEDEKAVAEGRIRATKRKIAFQSLAGLYAVAETLKTLGIAKEARRFICDPPPGARYLVTTDQHLSLDEAKRVSEKVRTWIDDPNCFVLVLDAGLKIDVLPGRHEWPDTEFCAA